MSSNAYALAAPDPRTTLSHVVGRLNAAHAELVTLIAEVLADESWVIGGIRSPEHWLTCYAGVSHAVAADLVQIARRTESLPALARGLDDGELSIGQATVIARYTPDDFDDDVVELARHATVPQLRRLLVKYEFAPAPQPDAGPQDIEDHAAVTGVSTVPTLDEFHPSVLRSQLQMHTRDGRFQLIYDAPADIGALVQQAVVEAKDALFLAGQPHVTLADGLTEVASRSLENGADLSGGRASKFRIYLHLDTAGRGWLNKGVALPPHLLRKWSCDGVVQPVWETEGSPVNVGRAQRIVPIRTRRLVEDRDGGCRHPGCQATQHVECHHVTHWADGGRTDMDALVSLCPHHHDSHHTGNFTIEPIDGRPGHFRFLDRGGAPLGPVDPRAPAAGTPHYESPHDQTQQPRNPYRGASGEALHPGWVRFSHNKKSNDPNQRRRLWILAGGHGDPPGRPAAPAEPTISPPRLVTVADMSDDEPDQPVPDELKVDVDQEKLANWDEVSKKYAGEGEEPKRRPVFTDDHASGSADDSAESDAARTSDPSDDSTGETLNEDESADTESADTED